MTVIKLTGCCVVLFVLHCWQTHNLVRRGIYGTKLPLKLPWQFNPLGCAL